MSRDASVEAAEMGASPGSQEAEGTADELLDRLLQCDEQLATLLSQAAGALRGIVPLSGESESDFETNTRLWFATLNVRSC